jgi:PAS domain S-box-containing protein
MPEPNRRKARVPTRSARPLEQVPKPVPTLKKETASTVRRRRAQDALRESELRFRTLAECAPVVVWTTDAEARATYISQYWREYSGRDPEQDLGYGWVEVLHPEDRERAKRSLMEAARSTGPFRGEFRVKRVNGDYGWLDVYGVAHFHADGSYAGHVGTCADITAHKEHREAGIEVQNSLVIGQEAERRRVAKELHDDIVQKLALVGLELSELEQLWLTTSPSVEGKMRALRQHVESIALDVHRISHNLHPFALIHLGFVSALRALCREFSDQTRIAIDFASDVASLEITKDAGVALYRITQECLTNVARHSGSRQANVSLLGRSEMLHLTISDTGRGFDTEPLPTGGGLGLVSIRERARMIGGEVRIASVPQRGTTVEIRVAMKMIESAD